MENNLMEIPAVNISSASEYQKRGQDLVVRIKSLTINNQADYEAADIVARDAKKTQKEAKEIRLSITKPLDLAKKNIMALFDPVDTACENVIRHINGLQITFAEREEKKRRELEVKLAAEAAAEEAKKRAALEKKAEKAEAKGDEEKADLLRQQAEEVQVFAPIIAPTVVNPVGLSFREDWSGEVVDLMALLKAIVAGQAPLSFVIADQSAINKQAKATKNTFQIPGIEFKSVKVPVRR